MRGTGEETGTTLETTDDTYGYRWMVLHDDDIEDLAVGVNAVSDALASAATATACCARSSPSSRPTATPVYFIYNYKRGTWYPFVPARRRAAARHRARAADQGPDRRRAAGRAGARALVPPLGHPI